MHRHIFLSFDYLVLSDMYGDSVEQLFSHLHFFTIYPNTHPLAIETQPILDGHRLGCRIRIVPHRILDLGIPDYNIVITGLSLVRAERGGFAGQQRRPVYDRGAR